MENIIIIIIIIIICGSVVRSYHFINDCKNIKGIECINKKKRFMITEFIILYKLDQSLQKEDKKTIKTANFQVVNKIRKTINDHQRMNSNLFKKSILTEFGLKY